MEWMAAGTALVCLFVSRQRWWRSLCFYVLYSVLSDFLSMYFFIIDPMGKRSNHYYYNFAYIGEILLYGVAFYSWQRRQAFSKGFLLVCGLWFIFAMANLLFIQGVYILNTYSFLVSYIVIMLSASYQMFQVISQSQGHHSYKLASFWVWMACLLSAVFSFAYRVFEPGLGFNNPLLFNAIIVTAAIVKYLFIAIAFCIANASGELIKTATDA